MDILESFDLYQSYNQAARECHCSPNTVKALVLARKEGTLARSGVRQVTTSVFDADQRCLVTELVDASGGQIRAKVVHKRLAALGYRGSERTTRRAVRREKLEAGQRPGVLALDPRAGQVGPVRLLAMGRR